MFGSSPFGFLGVTILTTVIGVALRFWFMYAGFRAFRGGGGMAAGDNYLSFDDRLAEKLRELEKTQPQSVAPIQPRHDDLAEPARPAAPLPTRSFGKRGL